MRSGIDCKGNEWIERPLGKLEDLSGCKFTKLTVLFPVQVDMRSKSNYWLCKCDCGNYIVCRVDCIKNQHIQSCGCMVVEGVYKKSHLLADSMIGKRFGKLIVSEFVGYKIGSRGIGKAMYKCKCDCGNDNFTTAGNALNCGLTVSCGCLTRSIGEENIESILINNNIYFKSEYIFTDLRSDKDGFLRYDFAVLDIDNKPIRLIEFDGEQHYKPFDIFGGEEKFKILQQNDKLKNKYALSHNIPLVRIPYCLRDTMSLDDLLGDKYLIENCDIIL